MPVASQNSTDRSQRVSAMLLDAGCVRTRAEEPFRLPSGWASPVYMDCRRLISFPEIRRQILADLLDLLHARGVMQGVNAIAGGEASGIAYAAWIADKFDMPLVYVRKKLIGQSQVEGVLEAGSRVLLIDDMMASAHTKRKFCRGLLAARIEVEDILVIFDYCTFPTQPLLAPLGVQVHSLATWKDVMAVAKTRNLFDSKTFADIDLFLDDPARWSLAHGGSEVVAT